MSCMATKQYKVGVDESLIERYENAAEKYKRRSGNQVASEVLEQYLDLWEQAEQGRLAVISQQRRALSKDKLASRNR